MTIPGNPSPTFLSPPKIAAPPDVAEGLLALVRFHATASGREWLAGAVRTARAPLDRGGFATALALAARQVGRASPEPMPADVARLQTLGVTWPVAAWGLDGLTRAGLLLHAAAGLTPGELETLVDECFRGGDTRERQAVLRTLPLLPDPGRFVTLAVDACRTSVQPVFEAIACENPYPALHFPEPSFNQMVLKAVFIEVAVGRILGLGARITPELRRMAADYASERRAAGRSVPDDVAHLLGENGSRS